MCDRWQKCLLQLSARTDNDLPVLRRDSPAVEDLPDDPSVQGCGRYAGVRTRFSEPEKLSRKAAERKGQSFQEICALTSAQKRLPAHGDERRLHAALPGKSDTDPAQQPGADSLCSVCQQPAHRFFIFPRFRKVSQETCPLIGASLRRICLGQIEAQVILFSAAVRKAHQQKPGPCLSCQETAVQKSSDSFCKLFRDRIILFGRNLQTHILAAAETDPLRKGVGIFRNITALLLRFFIQSVRQALRIAVSFLILQKNSICISVDRQKSDPVTHRECLLSAETVIDQHGPRSPGSRCAQYGIPAGRNAVAGILHWHTAAPVLLEIRQRYMCFHSARIPLVCLK